MINSAEEFITLRESIYPSEYLRAANDFASDETWRDILSRFPHMASWVALNKTISEDIIRHLSKCPDQDARLAIAMKRRTPEEVLICLATDLNDSVRMAVARHPMCPMSAKVILASDPWEEIRIIVAARGGPG